LVTDPRRAEIRDLMQAGAAGIISWLSTIFSGYNDVDIPFGIYHLYYHSGYTING
jgi:hypothetical protein